MRNLLTLLFLFLAVSLAQAQAPYVQVNSPSNGSQVGDRFTLRGNGPPNGTVTVRGSAYGQARIGPRGQWAVDLSTVGMPIGESVRLTVQATDAFGIQTAPVYVRYLAAYGNPTSDRRIDMSVNLPVNGSVVGNQFTLSGTGTPGATIEVHGTVSSGGYIDRNGTWRVPVSTRNVASGTVLYLQVRARDQYGNYSRTVPVKYAKR